MFRGKKGEVWEFDVGMTEWSEGKVSHAKDGWEGRIKKRQRQKVKTKTKNSSRFILAQAIVPGKEISKKYCKLPYYLLTPLVPTQLKSILVLSSIGTDTGSFLPLA